MVKVGDILKLTPSMNVNDNYLARVCVSKFICYVSAEAGSGDPEAV